MEAHTLTIKPVAHIRSAFPTKFGIPRQSGLAPSLKAEVVFDKEFAVAEAVRGLSDFSHIWLVWGFSEAVRDEWSPTVRPPRLGGNTRMGVFATRSPFRPNALGLSSVRLESVEIRHDGTPVLHVCGADLMDGTPIYDVKPYLTTTDCHPDAVDGFVAASGDYTLEVVIPDSCASLLSVDDLQALREVIAQDPRPAYQRNPERVYGLSFNGVEVKFFVEGRTAHVTEILR